MKVKSALRKAKEVNFVIHASTHHRSETFQFRMKKSQIREQFENRTDGSYVDWLDCEMEKDPYRPRNGLEAVLQYRSIYARYYEDSGVFNVVIDL
jgi:hypothetical protein